ncbi:hypothetical protein P4K96_28675, partial [Bacillus cereus]|nr:hypothetical protein [Bacillus cereus]
LQKYMMFIDFVFYRLDSQKLMPFYRIPCNGVHVIKEGCRFAVFSELSFEYQGGCLTVVKYCFWDTPTSEASALRR